MRSLAIDFGGSHIGVAVGEKGARLATPRNSLAASGTLKKDAEAIVKVAQAEEAQEIILGLALSHGEETKMSVVTRKLGRILEDLGCVVHYVDESLTSFEAESTMIEAGLKGSQRRKAVDSEAACLILERYWESQLG